MQYSLSANDRRGKDDAINVDKLDEDEFEEWMAQIAVATATCHVRGSLAKAPADFKNVMHSVMKTYMNRKKWRDPSPSIMTAVKPTAGSSIVNQPLSSQRNQGLGWILTLQYFSVLQ